jgi:hypothetical protein
MLSRVWWCQLPRRAYGVDATSTLLRRHGWDIHALSIGGGKVHDDPDTSPADNNTEAQRLPGSRTAIRASASGNKQPTTRSPETSYP